jgi:hypothetical protein
MWDRTAMKARVWAVLCTLSVLAISTGCDPLEDDCEDLGNCELLDVGTGYGVVCVPDRGAGDLTNGLNVIRYRGKEPLTIDKVDLVDGQGFGIAEVFVVPVRPELVGAWSRWPPPRASAKMRGARPAVGATMGAGGVVEYNLVAHLTRTGEPLAPAALRLFYTADGKGYGGVAAARLGVGTC